MKQNLGDVRITMGTRGRYKMYHSVQRLRLPITLTYRNDIVRLPFPRYREILIANNYLPNVHLAPALRKRLWEEQKLSGYHAALIATILTADRQTDRRTDRQMV